ncbi:hypothetical protein CQR48_0424 [Bifidobacterium thermophilum]|nr:hypothetical protein CQR48_0424 [Bifidobacterium thermophilum]
MDGSAGLTVMVLLSWGPPVPPVVPDAFALTAPNSPPTVNSATSAAIGRRCFFHDTCILVLFPPL